MNKNTDKKSEHSYCRFLTCYNTIPRLQNKLTTDYPGASRSVLGSGGSGLPGRAGTRPRGAGDVAGRPARGLCGAARSSARRRIVATARHIILHRLPYPSRGGDEKEGEEADHFRKKFPLHSQKFFQNNNHIK